MCLRETENLQTPSFVYTVDVSQLNCTKDAQHLPFKQRPMMAGQQEKKKKKIVQEKAPSSLCSVLVCTIFTMS